MMEGLYSSIPFYSFTTIVGALIAAEVYLRFYKNLQAQD